MSRAKATRTRPARPPFLAAATEPVAGAIGIFGAGYDETASFRPGARGGPQAIREASDVLETYSPALDRDLDDVPLVDLGDLRLNRSAPAKVVAEIRAAVDTWMAAGLRPFMLGGEHTVTAGAVAAVAARTPALAVVQFDAHADLRESYGGEPHSHACTMRRVIDIVGPDSLLQVGIRSGTRAEFAELRTSGRLVEPTAQALGRALGRFAGRPLYVSVDLDVFDPSVVSGTGTPEPGGIDWREFAALLGVFSDSLVVATDIVELAPSLDPSGASAVVAAKVVRELALLMGPSKP